MKTHMAVLIAISVAASMGFSASAWSEQRTVKWSGKLKQPLGLLTSRPGVVDRMEMRQTIHLDILSSDSNPLFDQDGSYRGYAVNIHRNGDRSYRSYEGTIVKTPVPGGPPRIENKATGKWVGGTGMFANIKGSYSCQGGLTPTGPYYECSGVADY